MRDCGCVCLMCVVVGGALIGWPVVWLLAGEAVSRFSLYRAFFPCAISLFVTLLLFLLFRFFFVFEKNSVGSLPPWIYLKLPKIGKY